MEPDMFFLNVWKQKWGMDGIKNGKEQIGMGWINWNRLKVDMSSFVYKDFMEALDKSCMFDIQGRE